MLESLGPNPLKVKLRRYRLTKTFDYLLHTFSVSSVQSPMQPPAVRSHSNSTIRLNGSKLQLGTENAKKRFKILCFTKTLQSKCHHEKWRKNLWKLPVIFSLLMILISVETRMLGGRRWNATNFTGGRDWLFKWSQIKGRPGINHKEFIKCLRSVLGSGYLQL